MKRLPLILGAILILMSVGFPRMVHASTAFFFDAPATIYAGTSARIVLRVSATAPINAIEGTIRYDSSNTIIHAIDDSDSVARLWVIRPTIVSPGMIHFAAMIPGGLSSSASLLAVIVEPKTSTEQRFWLEGMTAYLNQATPHLDAVTARSLAIAVPVAIVPSLSASPAAVKAPKIEFDTAQAPFLFNGNNVAVFQVHGGTSGPYITRIRERWLGLFGQWHEATNPYRLEDQHKTSIIELEVRDNEGNISISRIIPIRLWMIWGLLMGGIIAVSLIALRLWRGKRKNH